MASRDCFGSLSFKNIPLGNWVISEISQSTGFVLSDENFPVAITEGKQVIEIEISNEFITGNLHLTKYDADFPENKLSGAIFEVFRDSNGNKELDNEYELLVTMEETLKGIYEMNDICYGGVLVREKTASEGVVLDENVYYIMIDTNGKPTKSKMNLARVLLTRHKKVR